MTLLTPDWQQAKPTRQEARQMLTVLPVKRIFPSNRAEKFILDLRSLFDNGGAHLFGFHMPPDPVFDWYAARNRWAFDGLADLLFSQPLIAETLQEIDLPQTPTASLRTESSFLLPGRLAGLLHSGGAYHSSKGDGKAGFEQALALCDELFQLRFAEITCDVSYEAWTPWFHGIAWDFTMLIFDKRLRNLWILVVTDTD